MFFKRSAYIIAAVLLAVSIMSEPAIANVKRIASLPRSLRGGGVGTERGCLQRCR